MSFFRTADESGDSDTSEESLLSESGSEAGGPSAARDSGDSEDEEESDEESGRAAGGAGQRAGSRFLRGAGGDDSDEEESDEDAKKVVKSAQDKRLDEMDASVKRIENALKIDDWVTVNSGEQQLHSRTRGLG
jgi:translation initiation factor 3 subunit C